MVKRKTAKRRRECYPLSETLRARQLQSQTTPSPRTHLKQMIKGGITELKFAADDAQRVRHGCLASYRKCLVHYADIFGIEKDAQKAYGSRKWDKTCASFKKPL